MQPIGVVGIDPGTTGACAIFRPGATVASGIRWSIIDIPIIGDSRKELNAAALRDWLRKHEPSHAYLEFVTAMPSLRDGVRMGSMSAFQFGAMFGSLKATLACCDVPYTLVTPQKWKRAYLLARDKELARARAIRLFPDQAGMLARKKDQNRAEGMLIANYGAMQMDLLIERRQ